ncbi:uncharacterized protein TNCV_4991501 [Trichonephila clavipes]|nr:uncharacterized protein TNCV_4991501 [Trichonephila clavipes]
MQRNSATGCESASLPKTAKLRLMATRGLLATDHVILNHGQVTWTTPELAPPLLTSTPHQREDVSALDRFNVHRCPTRRVFSGTGLELVTRQATVRYLYHSATAATSRYQKPLALTGPLKRLGGPHASRGREEHTFGIVRFFPLFLPFQQPHEKTCGSMAIHLHAAKALYIYKHPSLLRVRIKALRHSSQRD